MAHVTRRMVVTMYEKYLISESSGIGYHLSSLSAILTSKLLRGRTYLVSTSDAGYINIVGRLYSFHKIRNSRLDSKPRTN